MDEFLKNCFSSLQNLRKEKLAGDGGHRSYIRIWSGKETFVLMSCGKEDTSLRPFIEIQKRLNPFVSVPKIFHKDTTQGFLLLEDLGDQSLEQIFFQKGLHSSLPFYYQALNQMIEIQGRIKAIPSDPLFDKEFFLKEIEKAAYHLQIYTNRCCKKPAKLLDEKSSTPLKKDMEKLLSNFKKEDYVYCHRDFHSRNLMVKENQTIIIDFQDAGLGPWYYDLTSLLYDSYVPLSSSVKTDLVGFYLNETPACLKKSVCSLPHIELMTKLQFLQRGFKACGRFAAFQNLDQKSAHLKYIKPTLNLLLNTAEELSYKGIYQYIRQLMENLNHPDLF